MNTRNLMICMLMTLSFASACKKDNNNPANPSGNPSGGSTTSGKYIKMKIDGRNWEDRTAANASGIFAFDGKYNVSVTGLYDNFEGEKSGLSIIFTSESDVREGTYDIKDYDGGVSVTKVDGKTYMMTNSTEDASFTVTISAISGSGATRRIRGTFSGTLLGPSPGDKITITGGEFSGY